MSTFARRAPSDACASVDRNVPRILLGIAVIIAAITRLGWLDLIEFQNDESWALSVASSIARGQAFPLVGIGSSLNVPNAPFFVYLMALPELVSRDPSVATGLIGLLGTAAVAATYGFAAYVFDQVTGAVAALLYAISPWGIIFSRKIWEQDALPLFVTLGFWALFASLISGRRWLIAPGIVLLTIATQLHPTAFFLAAPAAVLIVSCIVLDSREQCGSDTAKAFSSLLNLPDLSPREESRLWGEPSLKVRGRREPATHRSAPPSTRGRGAGGEGASAATTHCAAAPGQPAQAHSIQWLAIGLLGASFVEAPFVYWQTRHGWPLVSAVRQLLRDPGQFDLSALRWAGSAIAGSGYPALAEVSNLWKPAGFLEVGLLLGGLSLLAARALRPGPLAPRLVALAILLWIAAPVLAQIHHSVPIYPHYFIVLYPSCFMVMGVAVSWLWGSGARNQGSVSPRFPSVDTMLPRRRSAGHTIVASPRRLLALSRIRRRGLATVAVTIPVALGIFAFQDYVAALARGAVRPDFGVPLVRQEMLLDRANRLADGGPVYLGAHDSLVPTLTYLSDSRWRMFDDRRGLRLPASNRASVLAISGDNSRAATLATRWLGAERASTMVLTDWSTVTLYHLAPGVPESAPDYHVMNVAFDDGMTLSGYRIVSDSERREIRIDLHWRFSGLPAAKPPTVFNHLLDPRGQTVAQIDGLAYDPTDWRADELCLDEFDMPWPNAPGPFHLQMGLYDYPSMKRFHLLRPADGALDDSVDLGPVSLTTDKATS